MSAKKTPPAARPKQEATGKFTITRDKTVGKIAYNTLVAVDPKLYHWVKVMAAVNGVTITSVLNQAIGYAKKNSERISI